MPSITIAELAELLNAEFAGDGTYRVSQACHPADSGQDGALAVATAPEFIALLADNGAQAAVLPAGMDWQALGLKSAIFVDRPRYALSAITGVFAPTLGLSSGVDSTAAIDPSAEIGENAAIGPFVVVGPNVKIGKNAQISSHCSVGADTTIGDNALLHPGVRIGHKVSVGDRVIIHQNAVIGADGFSFVTPEKGAVEAAKSAGSSTVSVKNTAFARIHSLGGVSIGDDVEIGASTTIDRGTLKNTTIGSGTKVDNLVQVGHNVTVGTGCLLCAQVGIAGSASVGDRVVLGGKAGVADHVEIGSDVLVAAASAVASNVPSGNIMMGIPAQKRDEAMKSLMDIRRLPRLLKTVEKLSQGLRAKNEDK